IVYNSDTIITSGNTVTVGGSETITVTPGKVLTIGGKLEIAPYASTVLFIPPGLVDIKAITGRENGIVYIGHKSGYEGLDAIVITKDDTGTSKRGLVAEGYSRFATGKKFYRCAAIVTSKLKISSISGEKSSGYYIAKSEFEDNSSESGSNLTGEPYMLGVTYSLTYYFNIVSPMTDYNPSNWKLWSDVEDQFVSNYPYLHCYGAWYQFGNTPSSTTVGYSKYYHIFRKNLTQVSDNIYQGNGTYLYKYNYVYYTLFPLWDESTHSDNITSRNNGMVYIKDTNKAAMVVNQLYTTGDPNGRCETYKRGDTANNFTRKDSSKIANPKSIPLQTIDGKYYVAYGDDGESINLGAGLPYWMYDGALVSHNFSNYDPSLWQEVSTSGDAFVNMVTWPE
ncbi:MAG: hypothetical protein LBF56_01125, partial [Holosporales bacterium]|nr:hypothetical protein [Holosporales bacterium]